MIRRIAVAAIALIAIAAPSSVQTCADQGVACRARGHTAAECKASTDKCLQSGRWIGPAGNEFPISKKK